MKKYMYRSLLVLLFGIVLYGTAFSQNLWSNDLTNIPTGVANSANPYTKDDVVATGITVSGISYGPGLAAVKLTYSFAASGWPTGTAIDPNDYIEFTLTPDAGKAINFSSFAFAPGRTSAGIRTWELRSSLDGFGANIATGNNNLIAGTSYGTFSNGTIKNHYITDVQIQPLVDLSASLYQNVTTPVTFRIYGYGATAATEYLYINDFNINGDVVNVLPVVFGNVTAIRHSNGSVQVNWSTLKESQNSHFEIETSVDGKVFKKVATVSSKAVNGSSDVALEYHYTIPVGGLLGFAIPAMILSLCASAGSRRRKIFATIAVVAGLVSFAACSKSDSGFSTTKNDVFVRIAQVDKDGTKTYSKVIKPVAE